MAFPKDREWHEFPLDKTLKMPRGPHKRLRFYADANVPEPIVVEFRAAGLSVLSARERGYARRSDQDLCQEARQHDRVLLTMDRDFWDDKKHPLQNSPGIIFLDLPPDQFGKAVDGLARFYFLFAKYYPLDWWDNMKARVSEYGFSIRMRTWEGKVSEEEYRLAESGKLLTRTIR